MMKRIGANSKDDHNVCLLLLVHLLLPACCQASRRCPPDPPAPPPRCCRPQLLLQHGAQVCFVPDALVEAAKYGRVDVVDMLIAANADVQVRYHKFLISSS